MNRENKSERSQWWDASFVYGQDKVRHYDTELLYVAMLCGVHFSFQISPAV